MSERERSFIDNHKVTEGEYSTPTLRLAMWPAWRVGKLKGAQTAIGPSQSPSRSLETARPVGRASALDLCPGAKVSGSLTDHLPGSPQA